MRLGATKNEVRRCDHGGIGQQVFGLLVTSGDL